METFPCDTYLQVRLPCFYTTLHHLAGGYLISLTAIGRRDYIMLWVVFVKPPYALALQPIFGLIVFDPCIFSVAFLLQFSIFIYTYSHNLIKNPIACLSTNISGKIKFNVMNKNTQIYK